MTADIDTFCILPFVEFNLNPNGGVKPCCAYGRFVQKDGRPMSVYEHSIDEIWNSEDLLRTRERMIKGEIEPACRYCNSMDEKGLRSLRLDANEMWENNVVYNPTLEKIPAIKARVAASDYRLPPGGQMLNLDVGNLCNLKCRMCHSSASSMIASDPVHSKWSHVDPVVARWKGADLVFAPRPVLGVAYNGFTRLDRSRENETIWAYPECSFSFPALPRDSRAVEMTVAVGVKPIFFEVCHDDDILVSKELSGGRHKVEFPVARKGDEPYTLALSAKPLVESDIDPKTILFGIERAALLRAETGKSNVAFSRFPNGDQWFQNTDFLIGELLANPDQIRQINLVGGEPMLINQCMTVIRNLVETGAAKHMVLQLTTNGMVLPEDWIDLASQFRQVTLTISLDGYGPISEYIRYPSNWDQIYKNILEFKKLTNAFLLVNTTVQVYNMLHLVDMIRFCDEMKLEFRYHFLQGPAHLSPLVMPELIREEASQRIRRFAQRNDQSEAGQSTHLTDRNAWLLQLADAFLTPQPNWDDKKLQEFMMFTNDLDDSRKQNFKEALPELYEMIKRAGYSWNQTRKHAKQ